MKEGSYAVFRKFTDIVQAQGLAQTLKDNGIECELVDNSPSFDVAFSGNTLQNEVQVKINQVDFDKANMLLEKEADNLIDQVNKDHYLFQFSNDELFEILMKPDEWSAFDHKLAQRILIDRGLEVNNYIISSLREQRIKDLSKPEQNQKVWIYAGYLFAILGGLIGIFIGWYLWTSKKTLPNGQKVYAYNESDRRNGRNILIIGVVALPITTILRIKLGF